MTYAFLLNSLVVAMAVLIHYEFLYRTSIHIPKMRIRHRYRILFGIFAALVAHTTEIWLFALAYYHLGRSVGWGGLSGNFDGSLMDCLYFSFTTYTTLGFGDIAPFGHLRFLTGVEALTGLVLITWTASFLYYQMQLCWKGD